MKAQGGAGWELINARNAMRAIDELKVVIDLNRIRAPLEPSRADGIDEASEHVEADAHVILHVAPDPAREVRQVRLLPPLWQMKERCGVAGPVGAEPGPVGAEPATRDCGL
jgi:hypothetical protein